MLWTVFEGEGNPWISKTHEDMLRVLCKCNVTQESAITFHVDGLREKRATSYADRKAVAREFAIDWQNGFGEFTYSWHDLAGWYEFFEWAGRKYGLLREFRENGIC